MARSPLEYADETEKYDEQNELLIEELAVTARRVPGLEAAVTRAELLARTEAQRRVGELPEAALVKAAKYGAIDEKEALELAKIDVMIVKAKIRLAEKRADHSRSSGVSSRPPV